MSGDVITITDDETPATDDHLVCIQCTFRNSGADTTVCSMCLTPLRQPQQQQQQGQRQQQQQLDQRHDEHLVCSACTFRNEGGATVCCVCETPLVDDAPAEWHPVSHQMLGGDLTSNGGGSSSGSNVFIPSSADLKARTIAEGGDRRSNTPGLIPRLHERLLGMHGKEDGTRGRNSRGSAGTRERQTFMQGAGGEMNLCWTKDGIPGAGGKGASAEWRLCDQRTAHFTQRGARGSGFSCGYRNIQMLCSALMEWPEYKSVLFGGSGCVPSVALLQCWIERAWADGFDPEGCEQLGGHGALMGSETWIGATECATLLRSFGVKAEVIDFESTAPPAPPAAAADDDDDEARPDYRNGDATQRAVPNVLHDRNEDDHKRKTPAPFSSNHLTSGGGGGVATNVPSSKSLRPIQQCIRSFLPPPSPSSSPTAIAEHDKQFADEAGRWPGAGERLGTGNRRSNTGAPAGRGGFKWGGGPGGRGNGRRGGRGSGRGRGWRREKKRKNNGNIGKEAGDRMGKALVEWAWQYFCAPWATEGGNGGPGLSVGGSGGDVRSSSQLRGPQGGEATALSSRQLQQQRHRPQQPQQRDQTVDGEEANGLRRGSSSNGMVGGVGGGSGGGGSREEARTRPPPPLYFQHDGHSRSIVGVLLPEGGGAHATHQGGNEWYAGRNLGGGTGVIGGGSGGSVAGRGHAGGSGKKQQAGSLLVFDPSHAGRELADALDDTQKARWGRFLKRGEHSFQRRHFQMVAVRAGLVEPEQSFAWKTIESVKVWVA